MRRPGEQLRLAEAMLEQRRRSSLRLRLCGLFVARRHRTPLGLTLPDERPLSECVVCGGWRTICVFLGFTARVQGGVFVVVRLVLDFWSDERLVNALFGGGLGVGLRVANGQGGLILGYAFSRSGTTS